MSKKVDIERYLRSSDAQDPSSQHQHTSRSQVLAHAELTSRAKFNTLAARDERARRRSSHRHHHTHHAIPIVPMCAARPGSARAKRSNTLKIHAAARMQEPGVKLKEAVKAKTHSTHLCASASSNLRVSEREARPFPFR